MDLKTKKQSNNMKEPIKFTYRYNSPTKRYQKSKRKFIITGYSYLYPTQIKEFIKILDKSKLTKTL